MSDSMVKIIPKDPFYKIPEPALQAAEDFVKTHIRCDAVNTQCSETPVFVDCGGNLEKIFCPECHTELDFDWWGEVMGRADENGFTSLETELPCCGKMISLNDLQYDFPCGFACSRICILNPQRLTEDTVIDSVETILGIGVRVITAHI